MHEPLGAEAREIVIGQGGEALEEPSEYRVLFLHQYLIYVDSNAGGILADDCTSVAHVVLQRC